MKCDKINYSISEVLPHNEPMILLDKLLDYDPSFAECEVAINESNLFMTESKDIPGWIGLEFMAQTIAAHAGVLALCKGDIPKIGFLLGTRYLKFETGVFELGQRLKIRAESLSSWGNDGFAAYGCSIRDVPRKKVLMSGTLNVFQPDNIDDYIAEHVTSEN